MTLKTDIKEVESIREVRDTAMHTTDEQTANDVVFYLLYQKFVEQREDIPKESRDVLYYTLAMGHNTGVIDVFEPRLAMSRENFDNICAALPEGDGKFKLTRIEKFGEITILKEDTKKLFECVEDCDFSNCFTSTTPITEKYKDVWISDGEAFREAFGKLMDYIWTTPQVYCLARRVTR